MERTDCAPDENTISMGSFEATWYLPANATSQQIAAAQIKIDEIVALLGQVLFLATPPDVDYQTTETTSE